MYCLEENSLDCNVECEWVIKFIKNFKNINY